MVVYLSHWYRKQDRAQAIALFMAAIPLSEVIGAPLSGLLMQIRWLEWAGWRWLLFLEGLPAVVLGVATLLLLPDRPNNARWLTPDERNALEGELARERQEVSEGSALSISQALRNRSIVLLAVAYLFNLNVNTAFLMWLPKMVQQASGADTLAVALMVAVPFIADLPVAVGNAWHSDKTGERRWHIALPMFIGAAALLFTLSAQGRTALLLLAFSVATMSLHAYRGPFWALPSTFLSGRAAAASVGFISCFGNFGAFAGPWVVGFLRKQSQDFSMAIGYMAMSACLTGLLVLCLRSTRAEIAFSTKHRAALGRSERSL